jgi:hypothetical protein
MLPVLVATIALLLWLRHGALQREAGSALFHGEASLAGRLVGHTEPLPAIASRCSNCHESRIRSPAGGPSATAATPASGSVAGSYAVPLTRAWLTVSRPRRGGPPSAYDSAALCTVLRSGVDPVHVMISATMPRYEASDEHCELLWTYLTSR